MSDAALFLHCLLALLKRAERGEMLTREDVTMLFRMDGYAKSAEVDEALSFLSHFQVDADVFATDQEYLEFRKEQAQGFVTKIEAAKREHLQ